MGKTPESDAAWAKLNAILDANGGQDTPEYREAWQAWEAAMGIPAPSMTEPEQTGENRERN